MSVRDNTLAALLAALRSAIDAGLAAQLAADNAARGWSLRGPRVWYMDPVGQDVSALSPYAHLYVSRESSTPWCIIEEDREVDVRMDLSMGRRDVASDASADDLMLALQLVAERIKLALRADVIQGAGGHLGAAGVYDVVAVSAVPVYGQATELSSLALTGEQITITVRQRTATS